MSTQIIRMVNRLSFSYCDYADIPLFPLRIGSRPRPEMEPDSEIIILNLSNDDLTICDTGLFAANSRDTMPVIQRAADQLRYFAENNRIYAKREKDDIFRMLAVAPRSDHSHFSVLDTPQKCRLWKDGVKWRLYAYGTDNSDRRSNCRGWIFDAEEA